MRIRKIVTPVAGELTAPLFYNTGTGSLYYDADGNGTAETTELIARLTNTHDLDYSDFLVVA